MQRAIIMSAAWMTLALVSIGWAADGDSFAVRSDQGTVDVSAAGGPTTQPAAAQESTSSPAATERKAPPQDPRLKVILQTLQDTESYPTARAAYAKGMAIDRNNKAVLEAYVRKTLTLGVPVQGYSAAERLVRVDPTNGRAWGLIGYVHGRRNEYAKALEATLRAVEDLPDDPSILHNAGQLYALYDLAAKPVVITNAARRKLANLRDKLAAKEAFRKAYQEVRAIYQKHDQREKDLVDRERANEATVAQLRNQLLGITQSLGETNQELARRESELDNLRVDYRHAYLYPVYVGYNYGGYGGVRVHNGGLVVNGGRVLIGRGTYIPTGDRDEYGGYTRIFNPRVSRQHIRNRIDETERLVGTLRAQVATLKAQGRQIASDLKGKQDRLDQVRDEIAPVIEKIHDRIRWDPPAVNGVVTDEVAHVPTGPAKKLHLPADPERDARTKVKLAELYRDNRHYQKARWLLWQVLREYPDTAAAEDAKIMLLNLPVN